MIHRQLRKLATKKLLAAALLGAMLSAVIITGCGSDTAPAAGTAPTIPTATWVAVDRDAGDSGGEHSDGPEGEENVSQDKSEHGTGTGTEGREAGEGSGEHGPGGEGGAESREAAMSSPIIPLSQAWSGILGGLAVSMQYDEATRTVHGTVRNTLSEKLCYVQAEPHIKSGARTVGEQGPEKLGNLNPGQETTSSLAIAGEPKLAGVSYDGYVVHMEVFDCSGPGPSPHSEGEGSEGGGEHGRGEEGGREGRGEHGRGIKSDSESHGTTGEESDRANALASDESLDTTLSGARLILEYDAAINSFKGTVENTTDGVLERVRVEVHLSNGAELGPTTPTEMAPGELLTINLPATEESFTGWTAHAEVGGGGEESEHGAEHVSNRESGGEHGGRGEHRNSD